MNLIGKFFSSKSGKKEKQNQITIFLDSECKRSIETHNQNVENYLKDNQFQQDQFLYICIKTRKTGEIVLKRKLNLFENLGQALANQNNQQYKSYIIVGYSSERNTIPKINSVVTLTQQLKFIRSGTLQKYSQTKNCFEQCQLKLHHDYLTYYKLRSKCKKQQNLEKKVSFMPLENASVEMINQKKKYFTVKDKFKSIMFKTTSKEDMIGWLLAISEAIRIRNAQIYMNQLQQKMNKKIKDKLNIYCTRCNSLKQNGRSMLLDQIGRKSLREYFRKNQEDHTDIKMLSLIETYLYMCKVRREKGQQQSDPILESIRQVLKQLRQSLPAGVKDKTFQSKQDLIKAIEQVMRYLDEKYKKILLQKKYLHLTFQSHMLDQYKQNSRIQLKTLHGQTINK